MALARENLATLYDRDYALWLEATLERLRDRDYENVDWENLLDEIESMARSDRRALKSNLRIVILHLLKWQFQPEMRTGSWRGSIVEHRQRIRRLLQESPSLKNYLNDSITECYEDAREIAAAETGLALPLFPQDCLYSVDEICDREFFPGCDGEQMKRNPIPTDGSD